MLHSRQVSLWSRSGGGDLGRRRQMARLGASQMEFSLQVSLSDFSVEQRHFRRRVAEQFHERGKAHARSQHLSGKSVAKLMWDDGCGDAGCRPPVSYTHLRAHETDSYLVCRLLLE